MSIRLRLCLAAFLLCGCVPPKPQEPRPAQPTKTTLDSPLLRSELANEVWLALYFGMTLGTDATQIDVMPAAAADWRVSATRDEIATDRWRVTGLVEKNIAVHLIGMRFVCMPDGPSPSVLANIDLAELVVLHASVPLTDLHRISLRTPPSVVTIERGPDFIDIVSDGGRRLRSVWHYPTGPSHPLEAFRPYLRRSTSVEAIEQVFGRALRIVEGNVTNHHIYPIDGERQLILGFVDGHLAAAKIAAADGTQQVLILE